MEKIKNKKRKYEEKIQIGLLAQKDFLIERMREEWEEMHRIAKREKLIERAKTGGEIMARSILGLLALGGVLTVALVAPNVLGAYGKLSRHREFYSKKEFNNVKKYLKHKGYIRLLAKGKDGFKIEITEKGLKSFLGSALNNLSVKKLNKWDGWWWIVIFDIPEKISWARDGFREKLRMFGFYKLQHSVFVCPYPCEKELGFLIGAFMVAPYIHVIKTRYLSASNELKEHFGIR